MLQEIRPGGEMRDEKERIVANSSKETEQALVQRAVDSAGGAIFVLTKGCWTDGRFLEAAELLFGAARHHLHVIWESDARFKGEVRTVGMRTGE